MNRAKQTQIEEHRDISIIVAICCGSWVYNYMRYILEGQLIIKLSPQQQLYHTSTGSNTLMLQATYFYRCLLNTFRWAYTATSSLECAQVRLLCWSHAKQCPQRELKSSNHTLRIRLP